MHHGVIVLTRHREHGGARGGGAECGKAARALDPVFERQLLTYLKIMNLRLKLLMNFGHGHHEGWLPSHCQLSGSRPVAPCPPCPSYENDAHSLHRLSYNCHVFLNPTTKRSPRLAEPGFGCGDIRKDACIEGQVRKSRIEADRTKRGHDFLWRRLCCAVADPRKTAFGVEPCFH